jgi:GT2 family glycosyltransferase
MARTVYTASSMGLASRALKELEWLAFFIPRQGVQSLARRLPLDKLRDALPKVIGEKLRFGLYPARVTDAENVTCARSHAPWGTPAELDASVMVRYESAPRATVVLVTYNNLELTRLCLASLQRCAGPLPFELIVVDNASSDGTAAWLRELESRALLPLRVIENAHNRGYAPANNQAAELARGDVLVLLNNDTVLTPGWLDRLVAVLDGDASIGLVGPATNSCGNQAEVGTRYADLDAMQRFAAAYTAEHAGERVDLPMLTLFCAALRTSLYRQVGGLDEQFAVGMFEDDDLAMAVRRTGARVVLARDIFVHHYGGASFSQLPQSRYLRIWWENRRRFERKWRVPWQKR